MFPRSPEHADVLPIIPEAVMDGIDIIQVRVKGLIPLNISVAEIRCRLRKVKNDRKTKAFKV